MRIDPNDPTVPADPPEANTPPAEAAAATPAPDPAPVDATTDALAALSEGIAIADGKEVPGSKPTNEPQSAAPLKAPPAAEGEAPAPAAKPEPDKSTEDEIAALGLKEKAASRFREMAGEIKSMAPIRETLDKAGIKDLAQLPQVLERAAKADGLIGMVMDTGATPTQYGQALDYLALVNKAAAGDLKAAENAYSVMEKELAVLAQLLGKEVPGVHDPLAAHQDLRGEVEAGDLSRARALEIAQNREHNARLTQHQGRANEQAQAQAAEQQGKSQLVQWDQQMVASDRNYQAKRPILNSMVALIRQTMPPDQWLAATQQAYASIPEATPAPAQPSRPAPGPVRPGGQRPPLVPATNDPLEALNIGIAMASGE